MKNLSLIVICAAILFFVSGCSKEEITYYNEKPADSDNTTSSGSYQPVTKGSTWVYSSVSTGITNTTDQITLTMTGDKTTITGKTYYTATNSSDLEGSSNMYFYNDSKIYITNLIVPTLGVTVNLQYLDTSLPVGGTWTQPATDDGNINGVPAQIVGTIKELNISKVVGNQTFTNVTHTQLDLEFNYGAGFQGIEVYDYYIAKGIGIIEEDTNIIGYTNKQTLVSYTIK